MRSVDLPVPLPPKMTITSPALDGHVDAVEHNLFIVTHDEVLDLDHDFVGIPGVWRHDAFEVWGEGGVGGSRALAHRPSVARSRPNLRAPRRRISAVGAALPYARS